MRGKLFKQSGLYLLGNIALHIAGFVSLPILTRLLPVAEYGLLSLVTATLFIFVAITKFGLQHAGVRFYETYRDDPARQPEFYSTLFWGSLVLAAGMTLLLALGWELASRQFGGMYRGWLVWIVAGLVLTDVMIIRITNFMQVEQRIHHFNGVLVAQRYARVLLGIAFLLLISRTAEWYFRAMLLSGAATLLVSTFVFVSWQKIHPRHFSCAFLKECLRFGVPLQFMEISNLLIKFADKYLLQFFVGLSAVGVYAVSASLTMYVQELLFLPVTYAVFPLLMETYYQNGLPAAERLVSRVASYLLLLAVPAVVGFSLIRQDLVIALASEKFAEAATLIPLMITGAILWGFCQLFAAGLHISKSTGQFARVVFLGAVLNILLNLILIPKMSYVGAALATLITYAVLLILVARVSFRHLKVRVDVKKMGFAAVAAAVMSGVLVLIQFDSVWLQLPVKIVAGGLVYGAVLLLLDAELREMLRTSRRGTQLLAAFRNAPR